MIPQHHGLSSTIFKFISKLPFKRVESTRMNHLQQHPYRLQNKFRYFSSSNTTSVQGQDQQQQQPKRLYLWLANETTTTTGRSNNNNNNNILNLQQMDEFITTMKQNILLPPSAILELYHYYLIHSSSSSVSSPIESNTTTDNQSSSSKSIHIVQTVDDIVNAVNQHYNITHENDSNDNNHTNTTTTIAQQQQQQQFVGGMGEQDLGVYFVPFPHFIISSSTSSSSSSPILYTYQDSLHVNNIDLIQQGIATVKEIRHGIPFGIYTSGIIPSSSTDNNNNDIPFSEIDIDTYEVSLYGSTPIQYGKHTNGRDSDFHNVCQFILNATENYNVNVEASSLSLYYNDTRQLALSLGARDVHSYE